MDNSVRIKKLEDLLILNLADISNFHEGHPEYEILKGRIEVYAGEYLALTKRHFVVTRSAYVSKKD